MLACLKKREDWAAIKATYSFWQSERIACEDIIDAHQRSVVERAKTENIILAIQDTCLSEELTIVGLTTKLSNLN